MNAVLTLTRNNLALTKRTIASILSQDIPTIMCAIDNGSTDGSREWLDEDDYLLGASSVNEGVSSGWNRGLGNIFSAALAGHHNMPVEEHVLVIGNDTVLPPWFYRELLSYDQPFVTGIAVDSMDVIKSLPAKCPLDPHPDFSAFLIRRDCWEKVGPFDERMKLYASDCDFHVRAHRLGIPLSKANLPFYHERSSTLNLASPEERAVIESQANADREVFRSLYGCLPGTAEYENLFRKL